MINFYYIKVKSFFKNILSTNYLSKNDQNIKYSINQSKYILYKNYNKSDVQSYLENQHLENKEKENLAKGNHFYFANKNLISSKGYLTNNRFFLFLFPSLYLTLSILIILLILFLKFNSRIEYKFKWDIDTDKNYKHINSYFKIPSFYELDRVNETAFNLYIFLSCGCSLSIVFILFTVLKQRFKVPEYQSHTFKLNIMLIFSVVSNILSLSRSLTPLVLKDYFIRARKIQPNVELNFNQILFLTQIFFNILFSVYSLSILNLVQEKNFSASNNFMQIEIQINKNKWYLYKYITIFYLSVSTLVYILFMLNNAEMLCCGILEQFMNNYREFVLAMFPYFIHVMNSLLVFTFYFELKFVNMMLARNLDVDYLFDEEEMKI